MVKLRGGDKTPEHMTSAMTQFLNAEENTTTKNVTLNHRLMEQ